MDRITDEHGTRRSAKRPLLADARKWSDEELVAKLRSLGIPADRAWLRERCGPCRSAEEVSRVLYEEHGIDGSDMDHVWFCVTVLWERWFPDLPNLEMADDQMQLGYQRLKAEEAPGACEAWGLYWRTATELMQKWQITSVSQFDDQFSQTQCMYNWCQDYEAELGNAALTDRKYLRTRLEFCRQIIPLLDRSDALTVGNMRRAIAESLFGLGEEAEAQRLYEEWLSANPRWGWGWIGWSDLYTFTQPAKRDPKKAERILQKALKVPGLDERSTVLERLSDLRQEAGDRAKRQGVKAQPASMQSRSGSGSFTSSNKRFGARPARSSGAGGAGKVGRNDPCPCGSGKKYKRCCGR
jgi:tetratricopeptide (TPR) repeat protein